MKFDFPTSISTMERFISAFLSLLTLITNMEQTAHGIKTTVEELENKKLNDPTLSRLPHNLFCSPMKDFEEEKSVDSPHGKQGNDDDTESTDNVDEFGWCRRNGGWLDVLTGDRGDTDPYGDEGSINLV
ncbi:hypothetical protein BC941DRAFT_519163 [Chlamydoabsidia padenii]|nr:hypothetical protein BC941DRAFT_519163 [Chlamydoabsidia padenii]